MDDTPLLDTYDPNSGKQPALCALCSAPFERDMIRAPNRIYCSPQCQVKAKTKRRREQREAVRRQAIELAQKRAALAALQEGSKKCAEIEAIIGDIVSGKPISGVLDHVEMRDWLVRQFIIMYKTSPNDRTRQEMLKALADMMGMFKEQRVPRIQIELAQPSYLKGESLSDEAPDQADEGSLSAEPEASPDPQTIP